MKTFAIILVLFFVFAGFALALDDELQIVQGDDELVFLSVADDETGSVFSDSIQQNSAVDNTIEANLGSRRRVDESILPNPPGENKEEKEVRVLGPQTSENTRGAEALFDIIIQVDRKSKEVKAGSELLSIVNLLNLGSQTRVDTSIYYKIVDANDNLVYEEGEVIYVETQRGFLKRFRLPGRLSEGSYKLSASLEYPGQKEAAYSEDSFSVVKADNKINYLIFAVVVSVLLAILIIWYTRKKLI